MGNLMQKLFAKNKRQKLTIAAVVFILYVLALSGIFSYFQGSDAVTNRISAAQGSVTIQEPNWDSTGQYKARAAEPGMKIEKDPSGYNNGQVDLYIRLKMTIDLKSFDGTGKTDDYIQNYKDNFDPDTNSTNVERSSRRLDSILNAIKLADNSTFINGTSTNNSNFIMDTVNESGKTVYYFYYTKGKKNDENADMMEIVKPNESTKELFDHIDIPIYKKDYLGVFDQPYTISLEAEGIPATNYPDGLTVADIKDEQDNVIEQGAISIFNAENS